MENELLFNINALNPRKPVARVFDSERRVRCEIELGQAVHLWSLDLVMAAHRLYWTGMGLRDSHLNPTDGLTYHYPEDGRDKAEDMKALAKEMLNRVCRNNDPDRPRMLQKMEEQRFVLLTRKADGTEVYVSGSYAKPYFFTRFKGDNTGRYATFEDAVATH